MKRWWLPTQKGIERFPWTTIAPPKLVVNGEDISAPYARELIQPYVGLVKSFHGKCQQDYSLSAVTQMRRRIKYGSMQATYINQSGSETIVVEIESKAPKRVRIPGRKRWDWALIEVALPYTSEARLESMAHLRMPNLGDPSHDDDLPFPGIAYNMSELNDPLDEYINAPGIPVSSVGTTDQYASFLVDLRNISIFAQINLYARVLIEAEVIPNPIFGWGVGPVAPGGDPTSVFQPYPPASIEDTNTDLTSFPAGWTLEQWLATRADYAWDSSTLSWGWVSGENHVTAGDGTKYECHEHVGPPDSDPGAFPNPAVLWGIRTGFGYQPGYVGPNPSPAEVQITLFNGYTMEPKGFQSLSTSYGRWVYTDLEPRRINYLKVSDRLLNCYTSSAGGELSDHYGIDHIGNALIQVEFDEDKIGGASFEPAR